VRTLLVALICGTIAAAAPGTLKVRVKSAIIEMPLEQYVAAVLAGECSTFRSEEAIKAMAVAVRSYALNLRGRHAAQGYDLCATTHCQRLDRDAVTPRLASLAAETAGELLWFEGKPAFACYSRRCGGNTEDAAAVWGGLRAPFLRSHADPYCSRQGAGQWHWSAPASRSRRRRGVARARRDGGIAIAQRTARGGRACWRLSATASFRVAASSFRFAIGRALGFNTVQRPVVRGESGKPTGVQQRRRARVGLCQLAPTRWARGKASPHPGVLLSRHGIEADGAVSTGGASVAKPSRS
jgi:stage II sporulation protein D